MSREGIDALLNSGDQSGTSGDYQFSGYGTADLTPRQGVGRKLLAGGIALGLTASALLGNSHQDEPASAQEIAESVQTTAIENLGDRLPTMDIAVWSEGGVALDVSAKVIELTDQGESPCGEKLSMNDITAFMTANPGESLRRPEAAAEHLLSRPTLAENLAQQYEQGHYQGSKGNLLDWVTKNKVTGNELSGSDQSRYVKFLESAEIVQANTSFTAENHNCPDGETIVSVGAQTFEKGEFFWAINMSDAELDKMLEETGLEMSDLILLTSKDASGARVNSIVVNRALCDNPLEQIELDNLPPNTTTVVSIPPTLPPLVTTIPPTSSSSTTTPGSTSTTSTSTSTTQPTTSSSTTSTSTSTTSTSTTSTTQPTTSTTSTTQPTPTTQPRPETSVPAPTVIGGPSDPESEPDNDNDPENNTTTSTTAPPPTSSTVPPVTVPGTTTIPTGPYNG